MLTSKEVLERTGISRATLNNYISSGIVPRPEVLPPQPSDGAAPRIGYFPPDVIARIEEIQRLKRDGWSITRITEHFTGTGAARAKATRTALSAPVAQPQTSPALRAASADRSMPSLSFGEIVQPAYLVNDRFELVWANAAAGSPAWPNAVPLPADAVSRGVVQYLLAQPADTTVGSESRDAILRLHLGLARQRGTALSDLCRGLAGSQAHDIERLYAQTEPFEFPLVVRAPVAAGSPGNTRLCFLYALNFREGILFAYVAAAGAPREVSGLLAPTRAAVSARAPAGAPTFGPVAVLAMDLQDATRLWSELPGDEYFALIDQVEAAVAPILRRHDALRGKHPGEGLVCHFFPRPGSSYLWSAIAAAHEVREAMRAVSNDWRLRKGWSGGLYLNCGIDEGHAWHRNLGASPHAESTVLGDAARHATQLAGIGSAGAVWATRNLMDRLGEAERRQLEYGVRRLDPQGRDVQVASVFSRVADLAGPASANGADLQAIGPLPVTEIFGFTRP
ncbi:MAG: hypothetical protein ACAH21_09045 [Ramlibacter sp.]